MVARTREDQTLEDAGQGPAEFWGPTGQSWEQWVERQDDRFQLSLRKICLHQSFLKTECATSHGSELSSTGAYKQVMPLRGIQATEAQSDDF